MFDRIKNALRKPEKKRRRINTIQVLEHELQFHSDSAIEDFRTQHLGGEKDFLEQFLSEVIDSDTVWDIGANIGLFTAASAARCKNGRVFAFEPDASIVKRLSANILLNDLKNVTVKCCAIGDEVTQTTLYTDGVHGFSPSLRKQDRKGACEGQTVVQETTIDWLLSAGQIDPATVAKIDIEGAEILALHGMVNALSREDRPRAIFIEIHPEFLREFGATTDDCRRILSNAGYECRRSTERENEIQEAYYQK